MALKLKLLLLFYIQKKCLLECEVSHFLLSFSAGLHQTHSVSVGHAGRGSLLYSGRIRNKEESVNFYLFLIIN